MTWLSFSVKINDMQISFKKEIKEDQKLTTKEIIENLIKIREIKNLDQFINPLSPLKITLKDFGYSKEFQKILPILKNIKENQETIVVYTDYDADGITGGAILWETLNLLGFKVMPYVPHRKLEGYGFSKAGIDNVKKKFNPTMIISVDHGITAKEKIDYAKKIGIKVIVTDHHLKPDLLPDADAIFHIPELSGSGVAYFFAKEIFESFLVTPPGSTKAHSGGVQSAMTKLENNFSCDYLALAAIGTIADLVPLVGPSRSIVKHGLEAFTHVKREGIKHILKEACIADRKITPYEIGFIIAPRINAVGRLSHAIDALRLLCTKNSELAYTLAHKVGQKNTERQDLVKLAIDEAVKQVESSKSKLQSSKKIIILTSDTWHEGIIGLIASKIVEKYHRPAVAMTKSDGFLKGSARSTPHFHITDFLRDHKKYLIDVGGHKGAAGFTIEDKNLDKFVKALEKSADKIIKERDLKEEIEADFKIPLSKINLNLAKYIENLEPFGIGNPQPVFYSRGEIIGAQLFGKKKEHLKIYVKTDKISSFPLELIAFSASDKFVKLSRGQVVDLVYRLEVDRWGGGERLRGRIEYIGV